MNPANSRDAICMPPKDEEIALNRPRVLGRLKGDWPRTSDTPPMIRYLDVPRKEISNPFLNWYQNVSGSFFVPASAW